MGFEGGIWHESELCHYTASELWQNSLKLSFGSRYSMTADCGMKPGLPMLSQSSDSMHFLGRVKMS